MKFGGENARQAYFTRRRTVFIVADGAPLVNRSGIGKKHN